jgi:hypothetical protein
MKALVINNMVMDIEKRDIDIYDYYHKDIADMFIDCPEDVEIGYTYENGEFIKPVESEVNE